MRSTWIGFEGAPLLAETQHWTLHDGGVSYWIDLQWSATALVDLVFGEYGYGGLALRMPWREESGGIARTSEGAESPGDAHGRRARWVAAAIPIPGRPPERPYVTAAVMDHPSNPEHPVPWWFDGAFLMVPSRSAAGSWELPKGADAGFRHRVLVSLGLPDVPFIEEAYAGFCRTPPPDLRPNDPFSRRSPDA